MAEQVCLVFDNLVAAVCHATAMGFDYEAVCLRTNPFQLHVYADNFC